MATEKNELPTNPEPKPIKEKHVKHYWWRYLLVFLTGFISFGLVAVGGTVIASTQIKLGQIEKWTGTEGKLFTEKYRDYTIFDLFTKVAKKEVSLTSLNGIGEITPWVDDTLLAFLDDLGITEEEYENLANYDFSQYGSEEFMNDLFESVELSYLLSEERLGNKALSDAFCKYPTIEGGTGDFTLRNIINNVIYQTDIKFDTGKNYTQYMAYVTENITIDSVMTINDGDVLAFLKGTKLGDIQNKFENTTIGKLVGEDKCTTGVLLSLKDVKIGELMSDPNGVMNSIKIVDVFGINREKIEEEIRKQNDGISCSDFTNIQEVLCYCPYTVEEAIAAGHPEYEGKSNPDHPRTLPEIQGDNLTETINNLYVDDVINISASETNPVLVSLRGTKIKDLSSKINNLTVADFLTIDASSSPIMVWLHDVKGATKLTDLASVLNEAPLNCIVEQKLLYKYIDADGNYTNDIALRDHDNSDYNQILAGILTKTDASGNYYTLGNISEAVADLKLGDVLDPGDSKILAALSGTNLDGDHIIQTIKNLTISDFLFDTSDPSEYSRWVNTSTDPYTYNNDATCPAGYVENTSCSFILSSIMRKGTATKIGDLGTFFGTLTLADVIAGADDPSSILYDLSAIPLSSLTSDTFMSNIKIERAFADEIYGTNPHTPGNIQKIWKYLLHENGEPAFSDPSAATYTYKYYSYTLDDMQQMIDNISINMNDATLNQLVADDIIAVSDPTVLTKHIQIGLYTDPKAIGEYKIPELIAMLGTISV